MTTFFICAAAFISSWTGVTVAGVNISNIALVLAALTCLVEWVTRRRLVHVAFWMIAPIVGVFVVTVATAVFEDDDLSAGVTLFINTFLGTTLIAVLVVSEAKSGRADRLGRILGWWAGGIAFNALAATLVSVHAISLSGFVTRPPGDTRASGLAFHPNSLAFSLTLALPILVFFATSDRFIVRWRLLAFTGLALSVAALFFANSRDGIGVGLVSLVLSLAIALRSSRIRRLSIPLLLLGTVAVFLWLVPILDTTRLSTESGNALQSDLLRSQFNGQALALFWSHPLVGSGIANASGVSVPLSLLSGGGLVLAGLYYVFVFATAPQLLRRPMGSDAGYGLVVLIALVAFGVFSPGSTERATFWAPLLIAAHVAVVRSRSVNAGIPPVGPLRRRVRSRMPMSNGRGVNAKLPG